MPINDDPDDSAAAYQLPKYVRFARSLALISGAALGIAAGATVFGTAGCEQSCSGTPCPGQPWPTYDAQSNTSPDGSGDHADAAGDSDGGDGETDGGAGGGPRPAPHLPAAWLA